MLSNLKDRLRKIFVGEPFDPATLGDPLALKTSWEPIGSMKSNFRTHRGMLRKDGSFAFLPTSTTIGLGSAIVLIGLLVPSIVLPNVYLPIDSEFKMTLLILAVSTLYAVVGLWMLWIVTKPRVFDLRRGLFWKSWITPSGLLKLPKGCAQLKDIHALQLLYVGGNNAVCYELNLVLKDETRTHVLSHGDRESLCNDADKLGKFLGVPVWDARGGKNKDRKGLEHLFR